MSAQAPRGGRPPGARPLLLPALVVLAAAVASLAPATWRLDARELAAGEVWRLYTGHLAHATWPHFLLDVGAAAVLLALLRARWTLWVLPPLVAAGVLLLRPDLAWYGGLSGVLHGLTVLVALELARAQRGGGRLAAYALAAGVLLKAVLEAALGTSLLTQPLDMGGVAVYEAHLLGAVAGLVLSSLGRAPVLAHLRPHGRPRAHRRRRHRRPRHGLRAAPAGDPRLRARVVPAPRGQHP